ncbi:MAG: hypothetical protein M1831_006250 [Alyxoria varia]|nr:MAG: hypothetical protein M1831_006250 [Alyxoria varia]
MPRANDDYDDDDYAAGTSIKSSGRHVSNAKIKNDENKQFGTTFESHQNGIYAANPFAVLIEECQNDPERIREAYSTHRSHRQNLQRAALLPSPSTPNGTTTTTSAVHRPPIPQPKPDPILTRLLQSSSSSAEAAQFRDSRHNLTLWARPPYRIRNLVQKIQARIQTDIRDVVADGEGELKRAGNIGLWFPPPGNLHMTVLELAHSRSAEEILELVRRLEGKEVPVHIDRHDEHEGEEPKASQCPNEGPNESRETDPPTKQKTRPLIQALTHHPHDLYHHCGGTCARLGTPMISYDAQALALSFLPVIPHTATKTQGNGAANARWRKKPEDDGQQNPPLSATAKCDPSHTYHHLRAHIFELLQRHAPDIPVLSRYVVPSAHLTIARFVGGEPSEPSECSGPSELSEPSTELDNSPNEHNTPDENHTQQKPAQLLQRVVHAVDAVNEELRQPSQQCHQQEDSYQEGDAHEGGKEWEWEWTVGEETGLDLRAGDCWYGDGGCSVCVGLGI